eukprot:1161785-Pelagomonas_calceolata.AAC.8
MMRIMGVKEKATTSAHGMPLLVFEEIETYFPNVRESIFTSIQDRNKTALRVQAEPSVHTLQCRRKRLTSLHPPSPGAQRQLILLLHSVPIPAKVGISRGTSLLLIKCLMRPRTEKYRPRTVSDVAHQTQVVDTLTKALETANVSRIELVDVQ